jgi:hypothetical protein
MIVIARISIVTALSLALCASTAYADDRPGDRHEAKATANWSITYQIEPGSSKPYDGRGLTPANPADDAPLLALECSRLGPVNFNTITLRASASAQKTGKNLPASVSFDSDPALRLRVDLDRSGLAIAGANGTLWLSVWGGLLRSTHATIRIGAEKAVLDVSGFKEVSTLLFNICDDVGR